MIYDKIVFSKTEPNAINVIWGKPLGGGKFALYVFNDGQWCANTNSESIEELEREVQAIQDVIPQEATSGNQLADKGYVNEHIATNSADFKGTYTSVEALEQVTANNNDYAFVVTTNDSGATVYDRYKYVEDSGWQFEYSLPNDYTQDEPVISQSIAELWNEITGMKDLLFNPDYSKPSLYWKDLDAENYTCKGFPVVLWSDTGGAPSSAVEPLNWDADAMGIWQGVPMFEGQRYHDRVNKKVYEAVNVTGSTNDWVVLN